MKRIVLLPALLLGRGLKRVGRLRFGMKVNLREIQRAVTKNQVKERTVIRQRPED